MLARATTRLSNIIKNLDVLVLLAMRNNVCISAEWPNWATRCIHVMPRLGTMCCRIARHVTRHTPNNAARYLGHVSAHLHAEHEELVVTRAAGVVEQRRSVFCGGYLTECLTQVADGLHVK